MSQSFRSFQLFMAVLWVVHELMTFFLFWNLTSLRLQEQIEQLTTLRSSFSEHFYTNTDTIRGENVLPRPSVCDPGTQSGDPDLPPSDTEQSSHWLLRSPHPPDSDVSTVLTSSNEYMEVAEQYMGGSGAQPRRQQSVPVLNRSPLLSRHASHRPSSAGPYAAAQGSSLRTQDYGTVSLSRESLRVPSQEQGASEQPTVNGIPSSGALQPATAEGVRVVTAGGYSLSYYTHGLQFRFPRTQNCLVHRLIRCHLSSKALSVF